MNEFKKGPWQNPSFYRVIWWRSPTHACGYGVISIHMRRVGSCLPLVCQSSRSPHRGNRHTPWATSPVDWLSRCSECIKVNTMTYVTEDLIKEAPKHALLHCFWVSCLHRIVAVAPDRLPGGLAPYVYTPPCEGHDPF